MDRPHPTAGPPTRLVCRRGRHGPECSLKVRQPGGPLLHRPSSQRATSLGLSGAQRPRAGWVSAHAPPPQGPRAPLGPGPHWVQEPETANRAPSSRPLCSAPPSLPTGPRPPDHSAAPLRDCQPGPVLPTAPQHPSETANPAPSSRLLRSTPPSLPTRTRPPDRATALPPRLATGPRPPDCCAAPLRACQPGPVLPTAPQRPSEPANRALSSRQCCSTPPSPQPAPDGHCHSPALRARQYKGQLSINRECYPCCRSCIALPSPLPAPAGRQFLLQMQSSSTGQEALRPCTPLWLRPAFVPAPAQTGPRAVPTAPQGVRRAPRLRWAALCPRCAHTQWPAQRRSPPLPASSALPSCSHSPARSTQVAHAGAHTRTHRPRLAPTEQSRLTPSIQLRSGSSAWTPPGLLLWVPTPPGPGREQASASVQGTRCRLWQRVLMAELAAATMPHGWGQKLWWARG